jgi:Na+-driven multidrug efflux pump
MYAVMVVLAQSLALGLLAMVLVLATREQFPAIFTGDRHLQKAVSSIGYLLAVTMVLNSVQPVISGVAVGGGWQAVVAYINLGCYYAFGLPLGFILGYLFRFGVKVLVLVLSHAWPCNSACMHLQICICICIVAGHLGGHALRDSVADSHPQLHSLDDRLESRGIVLADNQSD